MSLPYIRVGHNNNNTLQTQYWGECFVRYQILCLQKYIVNVQQRHGNIPLQASRRETRMPGDEMLQIGVVGKGRGRDFQLQGFRGEKEELPKQGYPFPLYFVAIA